LIFGVLFALVPLFFSWVAREMRSQPNSLDLVLANGELFLFTAGICGAAVGGIVFLLTSPRCEPARPPLIRDG
jgi:hypothetical protein